MKYPSQNVPTACLIDGEHYLPNLRESLHMLEKKFNIRYLIFIGGTEKIGTINEVKNTFSYPVFFASKKANPEDKPDILKLHSILKKHPVKLVLDLSDEPIMDYETRLRAASFVLHLGIDYAGSDFYFEAPQFKKILTKPSLAIWGTGKRIGKTAIGGFVGRLLKRHKLEPAIVTLSRGGPNHPLLVRGDKIKIDLDYLLSIDKKGLHASSDCFEDALTARVPTFGCRRCGGGMAGRTMVTVLDQGVRKAEQSKFVKSVVIEGSGATVPEIKTEKIILVMDATQPLSTLEGYFTTFRILCADLIIINMCEDFLVTKSKIANLIQYIRNIKPKVKIATTVLRPSLIGTQTLTGKNIFLATTADPKVLPFLKKIIEKKYGCRVKSMTHHLAVRPTLKKEIAKALPHVDFAVTEVKAAAIAVVAREAFNIGLPTIFMDNILQVVSKGGNIKNIEQEILSLVKRKK